MSTRFSSDEITFADSEEFLEVSEVCVVESLGYVRGNSLELVEVEEKSVGNVTSEVEDDLVEAFAVFAGQLLQMGRNSVEVKQVFVDHQAERDGQVGEIVRGKFLKIGENEFIREELEIFFSEDFGDGKADIGLDSKRESSQLSVFGLEGVEESLLVGGEGGFGDGLANQVSVEQISHRRPNELVFRREVGSIGEVFRLGESVLVLDPRHQVVEIFVVVHGAVVGEDFSVLLEAFEVVFLGLVVLP